MVAASQSPLCPQGRKPSASAREAASSPEARAGATATDGRCPSCGRTLHRLRTATRNKILNANLRDIARHRYGGMTVPARVFDRVVEDFKRTDIWPRESDSDADYFTGEVLYRPKSRGDLTQAEAEGITRWLEHYMIEHYIPSHAPEDNWQETR